MLIAVDTETNNDFYPFGVSLAWYEDGAVVVDYISLSSGEKYKLDPNNTYVFHNAKFDLIALLRAGCIDDMDAINFHDTETLCHLINEHQKRGLKHLAREVLGLKTVTEERLIEYMKQAKMKRSDGYDTIPLNIIVPYALDDARYTLLLYDHFEKRLPADLRSLYELELKVTRALLRMEMEGMKVDLDRLNELNKEYSSKLLDLELRLRDLTGNDEFNPNSPIQVKAALSELYGIDVESTGEEILLALPTGRSDAFVLALLEYRATSKILRTYIQALKKEHKNGILHPNFRQHGARTGRMSSGAIQTGD